MNMRTGLVAVLLVAGGAAACGESGTAPEAIYRGDEMLANGMTIKQQIEARQHNLKDLGGAFKTVNDQLKTGSPQIGQILPAAQEVRNHSLEIAYWFPEGTGPDAGVKTEALDTIWTDAAGYAVAIEAFQVAAAELEAAAQAGDLAAVQDKAGPVGAACKSCHDAYRLEKS